ncbi:TPR domain-containing protein [Photobacterium sp. DNB23_23_1]|uniref:Tetratricopeptide repeat protein n=1 Tax=Photobacterium pectinilyticum TaxID=2906793 RepID=A0ABT1MZN2_9GAMM|nr:tetratricopeptide repeat protein [Photobacterium sp. ZSDE20]MCQ1057958.1 tetratricopeptide repeat protein [Photobacterium sp. ZSDE20]MDD1822490.1 tetratricopeptide repeat protein [Photobacterium sp. ZSDE20]
MLSYQGLFFLLLLVMASALVIGHSFRYNRKVTPVSLMVIGVLSVISVTTYAFLGHEPSNAIKQLQASSTLSEEQSLPAEMLMGAAELNQKRIEEIQDKLREDTQNGELWYALGNAYMYSSEFESAGTAFLYALRLAPEPQSNIYSAMATASYYQEKQYFTTQSKAWLDRALELDENNIPALMLLASDYFLNARYQKAIDTWQQLLDTERTDLDRVEVINAINRAKSFL